MDGACGCGFHLRVYHSIKVETAVCFFEISVQLFIGNLIAFFVFAVIWQILLDCIVGEVH